MFGGPKIERSDLSGHKRTVLLSSAQGLVSPTTLVVDFSSRKLYWLDSHHMDFEPRIGRVNFDGSEIETWTQSIFRFTTCFAIYQVRYATVIQTGLQLTNSRQP